MSDNVQAAEAPASAEASAELQPAANAAPADGAQANGEQQQVDDNVAPQAGEQEKQDNQKRERFDRRFSDLSRRARDAEIRAARLEGELSALKNGAQPRPQEQAPAEETRRGAPDPKSYAGGKFDERYVEDYAEWKAEEAVAKAFEQRDQKAQKEQSDREREEAYQQNAKRFHETRAALEKGEQGASSDEIAATYQAGADLLSALDRNRRQDIIDDITISENQAQVARYIAAYLDADQRADLFAMSPVQRTRWIGNLDQQITRNRQDAEAKRKQTQTQQPAATPAPKPSPAPTPQVNGQGVAPNADPNRMSMEEFAAWRHAQMGVAEH